MSNSNKPSTAEIVSSIWVGSMYIYGCYKLGEAIREAIGKAVVKKAKKDKQADKVTTEE